LVRFFVLGPLEVRHEAGVVSLGGVKQRALLAVLLLRANEVVARETLIDELWGEEVPERALQQLNVRLSRLRKSLENGGQSPLVTTPGGYLLRIAPGELDLQTFQQLVEEGRQALRVGDARRASESLREGLSLWRGQALSDLRYEPFAQVELDRLEELRLAALEDRLDADLALSRHSEVVSELEALVAHYPLRERLRAQLMLALYRSGRQADALRAYRETRRELVEELGIEPGPSLRELESKILRHDVALASPADQFDSRTTTITGEQALKPPLPGAEAEVPPDRPTRSLRGVLILAVALTAAAAAAGALFATARGPNRPQTVAVNRIVIIDPKSNAVSATAPVGTRPSALVEGSGSVWVANLGDQTITRVDPRSWAIDRTIPVAVKVAGLASGAGGIWYSTSNGRLYRIEPSYDTTAQIAALGENDFRFARPQRPVAVAFGSVWVVDASGFVARVDPATGRVLARIPVGTDASAIAAGAGAVWVASPVDDTVAQIDPTNAVTTIRVGHGPSGIAVGVGAVWVTDRYDDTVQRIDPDTSSVVTTIHVGSSPQGVAVGDGAVWVADSHDGTITRIDPTNNGVVSTIPVGGDPTAVATVAGKPWITISAGALPPAGKPDAGIARFNIQNDFGSPDPALAFDSPSWQIEAATCGLLAGYPDQKGPSALVAQPDLARSVSHSADGKTWTFALRRGMRFSPPSDEEVNARTVKHSLERALDPRMNSAAFDSYFLPSVVGESAFTTGKARHISGILASGYRLTIKLEQPLPDLLARLAVPYFCIVPSNTPVDPNGLASIPSAGPYYVASYVPGQELVLRRNPNYSGSRSRRLAEMIYEIGIGQGIGEAMVEQGRSDYIIEGPPAPDEERLTRAALSSPSALGHARVLTYPSTTVRYLVLNTRRPLFARVRVRQALSYAIDRTALARLWDGLPTEDYVPPGVPGQPTANIYPLHSDVSEARILAGRMHATALLYTCDVTPCPQIAALLTSELARIGISLRVKEFGGDALYRQAAVPNAPYDIVTFGWEMDWLDPGDVLRPLFDTSAIGTPDNTNLANFSDPRLSARLAAALRLYPPERYLAVQRLVLDLERAAPVVAYSADPALNLFSSRIGCQIYQPLYGVDLGALCLNR
jgi:YVTN family beta-propeller protein